MLFLMLITIAVSAAVLVLLECTLVWKIESEARLDTDDWGRRLSTSFGGDSLESVRIARVTKHLELQIAHWDFSVANPDPLVDRNSAKKALSRSSRSGSDSPIVGADRERLYLQREVFPGVYEIDPGIIEYASAYEMAQSAAKRAQKKALKARRGTKKKKSSERKLEPADWKKYFLEEMWQAVATGREELGLDGRDGPGAGFWME